MRVGVVALALAAAACGPHYLVWPEAHPSPAGYVAARRDTDAAIVAVRPAELHEIGVRDDGAAYLGRRITRPRRFRTGVWLFTVSVPLVVVSLIFGVESIGQNSHDGDVNRGIAIGFGAAGGAAMGAGIGLFSWAWPPRPTEEPIAAHPELVDMPPAP